MKSITSFIVAISFLVSQPSFSQTSDSDPFRTYVDPFAALNQNEDSQYFRLNCSDTWYGAKQAGSIGAAYQGPHAPFGEKEVDLLDVPIAALERFVWRKAQYSEIDNSILTRSNVDQRFESLQPLLNDFKMGQEGYNQAEAVVFSFNEMRSHAQELRSVLSRQKSFLNDANLQHPVTGSSSVFSRGLNLNRTWKKHYSLNWSSPSSIGIIVPPKIKEFCRDPDKFLVTLSGQLDPELFHDVLAWKVSFQGIFHSLEIEKPQDITFPISPYQASNVIAGHHPQINIYNQVTGRGEPFYRKDLYEPLIGNLKDLDLLSLIEGLEVANQRLQRLEVLVLKAINERPNSDTLTDLVRRHRELLRVSRPLADDIQIELNTTISMLDALQLNLEQAQMMRSTLLIKRTQALQDVDSLREKSEMAAANSTILREEISTLRTKVESMRDDMFHLRALSIPADMEVDERRRLQRERTDELANLRVNIRADTDAVETKRSELALVRDSERSARTSLSEQRNLLSTLSVEIASHGASVADLRLKESEMSSRLGKLERMAAALSNFHEKKLVLDEPH